MTTMTSVTPDALQKWLLEHPAPVHHDEVPAWVTLVVTSLGPSALPALFAVLASGDAATQYQAVAALRALEVEVWAQDADHGSWDVRLPDGGEFVLSPRIRE